MNPNLWTTVNLSEKYLLALLNALVKRRFENDSSITIPFLRDNIFSSDPEQVTDIRHVKMMVKTCDDILKQAAGELWSLAQMEKYVQSASACEGMPDSSQQVFVLLWKQQKDMIHKVMVDKSRWTGSLASMSWRIDVSDSNVPTAVIEMQIAAAQATDGEDGQQLGVKPNVTAVQFEIHRQHIQDVVGQLDAIEKCIASST